MVFADAAVRDQASGLRAPGYVGSRPAGLHARVACRGRQARVLVQDGPDLHAAGRQQVGRPARHADHPGGHRRCELAGRGGGSGDGADVCGHADESVRVVHGEGHRQQRHELHFAQRESGPRRRAAVVQGAVGEDHGGESEHGRACVDGAARGAVGCDQEASSAAGYGSEDARRAGTRWAAGHKDAAVRNRWSGADVFSSVRVGDLSDHYARAKALLYAPFVALGILDRACKPDKVAL